MIYHFSTMDRELPIYVESVGQYWQQEFYHRPNGYPFHHWIYCTKGSGIFTINNQSYYLNQGDSCLLRKDIPHTYSPQSLLWEISFFTFDGFLADDFFDKLLIKDIGILEQVSEQNFQVIVNHGIQNYSDEHLYSQIDTSVDLYRLLLEFAKLYKNDGFSKYEEVVKKVILYFNMNFDQPYKSQELSQFVGYSINALNTIFKNATGSTLYAYFQDLKIRKAKSILLTNKQKNIQQISDELGYTSPNVFITKFRTSVGIAPLKYRNQIMSKDRKN